MVLYNASKRARLSEFVNNMPVGPGNLKTGTPSHINIPWYSALVFLPRQTAAGNFQAYNNPKLYNMTFKHRIQRPIGNTVVTNRLP